MPHPLQTRLLSPLMCLALGGSLLAQETGGQPVNRPPTSKPAALPAADHGMGGYGPGAPGMSPGIPVMPDGRNVIIPEVAFDNVPVEEVLAFLQDTSKEFRAVLVKRGKVEGPKVSMRLRNVSVGQVLDVISAAYPGVMIGAVNGPTGVVHVVTIASPGFNETMGMGGAMEPSLTVRVYRLAGIVDTLIERSDVDLKPKEAMDQVLSLIKATLSHAAEDETPTLQVHEETQTLILKGTAGQHQAIGEVMAALAVPWRGGGSRTSTPNKAMPAAESSAALNLRLAARRAAEPQGSADEPAPDVAALKAELEDLRRQQQREIEELTMRLRELEQDRERQPGASTQKKDAPAR